MMKSKNKKVSNKPSNTQLALLLGGTLCILFPSLIMLFNIQPLLWIIEDLELLGVLIFGAAGALLLGSYVNATSKKKSAPLIAIAISLIAFSLTFVLSFLTLASRFSL